MPIGIPTDRADVVEGGAAQAVLAVNGSPVELKSGGSRLTARQFLVIFNDSAVTVFTGPSVSVAASGVNKGLPLFRNQERIIPVGDRAVYAITAGGAASVLVQEFA